MVFFSFGGKGGGLQFGMSDLRLGMWCVVHKTPQKHQTHAELLYHVVASEEGVDGVKVVVKELRHTVDDVKGDGL